MKILVTPTSFKADTKSPAMDKLRSFASELVFNPSGKPLEEGILAGLLKGVDGYIAGLDNVSAGALAGADRLKVISRYGVGCDRMDLSAAKAKGIKVCNTPGANSQAVADLTLGLILACARRIPMLDRTTREGGWVRSTGIELDGKTIGILGLGAIGKAVAKRAQGFDMNVMAYDPFMNYDYAKANHIAATSFDDVIEHADVLTLHLPLNKDTKGIISAQVMAKMKNGVILVNPARGGLIDEKAAYDCLKSGKLGGLGLDAYETEPPKGSPLFEFDNVVATPHTGAHTAEASANMAMMAVDNLIAVLSGKECKYIVNA
jgi:D-3-phosphoglycerate dehydrogenase